MNCQLAAVRLTSLRRKDRLGKYLVDFVTKKVARKFDLASTSEVLAVAKMSLNMGIGKVRNTKDLVGNLRLNLTKIAGQHPTGTKVLKAIANFKVRRHEVVGLRLTIRRRKMWEFFDRLVNLAVPQLKDFRGIASRSFDGSGNLSVGLPDCSIFPELGHGIVGSEAGMTVTLSFSAGQKCAGPYFLRILNFPLLKR